MTGKNRLLHLLFNHGALLDWWWWWGEACLLGNGDGTRLLYRALRRALQVPLFPEALEAFFYEAYRSTSYY